MFKPDFDGGYSVVLTTYNTPRSDMVFPQSVTGRRLSSSGDKVRDLSPDRPIWKYLQLSKPRTIIISARMQFLAPILKTLYQRLPGLLQLPDTP